MSHVTDIILITSRWDGGGGHDSFIKQYPNVYKLMVKTGVTFQEVSDKAAGNKNMQAHVFMSAMNYLDIDNFICEFEKIKWEYPECVQLLIKDEHGDCFKEYKPSDRKEIEC